MSEEEQQFIDAVRSLANQEFLFQCHDESSTSLNKGNLMEFLNVLKLMAHFLKII
jgi:hypothetical protein